MKSRTIVPELAPHITIRISGKLFEGHLQYLGQLIRSAAECHLWPVLNLEHLEEVDHAALVYLREGENRDFTIASCPSFIRDWTDEGRGQAAA